MNFFTVDHDRSEKPEKTPPSMRMDLIVNALNTLQNAKIGRAEERYGKVASHDLFTNGWDNFRKYRAAGAIIDNVIPKHEDVIKAVTITDTPKETILDGEVTINPSQFEAMVAEKHLDDIETELQTMITDEYSKEIDSLDIDSLMEQANGSAVSAKESYERIAKITQ